MRCAETLELPRFSKALERFYHFESSTGTNGRVFRSPTGISRHVRRFHQTGPAIGLRHRVVVQAVCAGHGRRFENRARVHGQRVGSRQRRAGRAPGVHQLAVLNRDRREHAGRRAGAQGDRRGRRRGTQAAGRVKHRGRRAGIFRRRERVQRHRVRVHYRPSDRPREQNGLRRGRRVHVQTEGD